MSLTVNPAFNNDDNKGKTSNVSRETTEPASTWTKVEAHAPEKPISTGDDYSSFQQYVMKNGKAISFTDGTKAYLCEGLYYAVGNDGKPLAPPTLIDENEIASKEIVKQPVKDSPQTPTAKRNKIPPAIQSKISMMKSGVSNLEYNITDKEITFKGDVSLINSDFINYNKSANDTNMTSAQRMMKMQRLQNLAISQAIYQDLLNKNENELSPAEIRFMNRHEQNMIKLYKDNGEM